MSIIRYENVVIEREEQTLFDHLNLSVEEGEFIYLIGKVGMGKSSLLKTFYGELPISSGDARVFDFYLHSIKKKHLPYLRRKLGIIFQDFRLLHDRTVYDNLLFVLRATGWKEQQKIDQRIREVLKLVGMDNKGYRMPNTLSGGEQQRVVIARSLLNHPELILADEPTGNLDPETANEVVQLLYSISKSQHTAVIISTHNRQFLIDFPGRVLKVEDKKLIDLKMDQEETQSESISSDTSTSTSSEAISDISSETTISISSESAANASSGKLAEGDLKEESLPENTLEETLPPAGESEVLKEEVLVKNEGVVTNPQSAEAGGETQNAPSPDSVGSNNAEDHLKPSDTAHEEPYYNAQSDQKPLV